MISRHFYFAHPTSMYGTPVERKIVSEFEHDFPDTTVENPNQPRHSEGYKREGMDYFVKLCGRQDGVFFAPHADGSMGAGVVKEVQSFLDRHAPVYRFDPATGRFRALADLRGQPRLSVDQTRAQLRRERAEHPFRSLRSYAEALGSRVDRVG